MIMETLWRAIDEFPTYSVSNYGDVVDESKSRFVSQSVTLQGALKVNISYEGGQVSRSVKRLVAQAFVEGQDAIFNTPIQLDGDQVNVRADNIMWRPRWFAWKYCRQFVRLPNYHSEGPIIELESQVQYFSVYEASIINGILMQDIWGTIILTKPHVFPTWQRFWLL